MDPGPRSLTTGVPHRWSAAAFPWIGWPLSLGSRFRWLTAPRSTIVQTGPVHAGLTHDPEASLDRLMTRLVH